MSELNELAVLAATDEPWQLVYQDSDLLIVAKPARLLTVPGRHPANHDCLISRVQREFPAAAVVHRLDYDTSGLVVLPLNKAALSDISKQFQARTVDKKYQALAFGKVPEQGDIELPIAPDAERRPLYKICAQSGKPSHTRYQRLDYDAARNVSRLLLEPVTGRSHQLRLHLASIGHPLLGDEFYAPAAVQQMSARLCLQAFELSLTQPGSGKRLTFSLAADF